MGQILRNLKISCFPLGCGDSICIVRLTWHSRGPLVFTSSPMLQAIWDAVLWVEASLYRGFLKAKIVAPNQKKWQKGGVRARRELPSSAFRRLVQEALLPRLPGFTSAFLALDERHQNKRRACRCALELLKRQPVLGLHRHAFEKNVEGVGKRGGIRIGLELA